MNKSPAPPVHATPEGRTAERPEGEVPTGRGDAGILHLLSTSNPEAILWDGFDDALVGVGGRCALGPVAVYDRAKCIEVLKGQGLSCDDAEEYFCYNVEGCYAGEYTPIIVSFHG